MTKPDFDINNLRIASPCSVGWETMSGDERTRHCNLCRLNVYNVSEMTADEVRALIAKSEGRICARLYKRADGTILTKDCPVGWRAYQKRATRLAGAALATILGLFSVSFGQKEEEKSTDADKAKIVRTIGQEIVLKGKITDLNGAIISAADVTIFKGDGEKLKIKSDEEGVYRVSALTPGIYTLEVESPGFKLYRIADIEINYNEELNLDIELLTENVTTGVVEVFPETVNFNRLLTVPTEINTRKPEKPPR